MLALKNKIVKCTGQQTLSNTLFLIRHTHGMNQNPFLISGKV